MRTTSFLLTSLLLFVCVIAWAESDCVAVTIKNPMRSERTVNELVEVDARLLSFIPTYATTEQGDTMPCQLTYDSLVVFPRPQIKGKGKVKCFLHSDRRKNWKDLVHGRLYPERQSDFSFENDRIAYRIYGPGTRDKGERLYGYDIFLKRTPELILDKLYALQCDKEMWSTVTKLRRQGLKELADDVYQYGFCYHVDHGEGMDVYKVGSTLGAGTNALIVNDEIVYPWGFQKAEILDDGPLRFTVKLTGYPFSIGNHADKQWIETRILTLDVGQQMVRAEIKYSDSSAHTAIYFGDYQFCAAIAVHKENPNAYITDKINGIVAYEDLGDPDIYRKKDQPTLNPQKGSTFIGCILPDATDCRFIPFKKETSGTTGHISAMTPAKGTTTYYFGYAWNRSPMTGITTMEQWKQYMDQYHQHIKEPVQVSIQKHR